ncbi:MAG: hypothetical protein K0U66_02000, partial [Gammaproteobacteria bacterium]|nr:hypothetical protein [Gammaproteobacteria bacterium]
MPDWTNKINAYTGSAVPASIRRYQALAQLGRRISTGLAVRVGIAVLSAGIRCCKALAQLRRRLYTGL